MRQPRPPRPARLICELIAHDVDLGRRAGQLLTRAFGPIEAESRFERLEPDWMASIDAASGFESGSADSHGAPETPDADPSATGAERPLRGMIAFARLIEPGALPGSQREAWEVEQRMLEDLAAFETDFAVRIVAGYATPSKLITADRDDAPHRIYLSAGVYAEVTLERGDGAWRPLPWTRPRHADSRFIEYIAGIMGTDD